MASEERKELNQKIVLQILREGGHPSAQRVLSAGGRGTQGDVLKDIRETLIDLATMRERPGIPEEVFNLSQQAVDVAWNKLEPYRKEADAKVAAATEAVALAEIQRKAALEHLEASIQQRDELQQQLEDARKALAAEQGKRAQLEGEQRALAARFEQLRDFSEQRAAEMESFRAAVAQDQEARSREHAEAMAALRQDHAEALAAERVRCQELETRYQESIKGLQEEQRRQEGRAASREAELRKELDGAIAALRQLEKEAGAAQATERQLVQQKADLQEVEARLRDQVEALQSDLQQANAVRSALEAEVRLLREQSEKSGPDRRR